MNTIEQAKLIREIAVTRDRIKRIEDILSGRSLKSVNFADISIEVAKILGLSADKITTGTLQVGEKILVSDGTDNRILIDREKILISVEGVDVETTITETNKKDFVLISGEEADKLVFADIIESTSYTHSLGYVPYVEVYEVDDADTPTEFTAYRMAKVTTSQVTNLPNPCYLLLYYRDV